MATTLLALVMIKSSARGSMVAVGSPTRNMQVKRGHRGIMLSPKDGGWRIQDPLQFLKRKRNLETWVADKSKEI